MDLLRKDTAKRYREIRKILATDYVEDKTYELYAACAIYVCVAIILGMVFLGCDVAHAEDIDLGIIVNIESSGHTDAYNRDSRAVGLCQITPMVLKEYNSYNFMGMTTKDLFIAENNIIVADWYLNKRIPSMLRILGISDNFKNRLWAYNAGIGNVRKGIYPKETKEYIIKYNEIKQGDLWI